MDDYDIDDDTCFWTNLWNSFIKFLSFTNPYMWCDNEKHTFLTEVSQEKRVLQYDAVYQEARELFINKNKDYGDAFASYGPIGVLVRMGDKTRRLSSIEKNKIINVNDESIRDTLIDLHNYSAMAIMLMDE
tara:strand:+ start:295 stop:687 length:393 start_codon:yes stop_codon:yes gene_type:complete